MDMLGDFLQKEGIQDLKSSLLKKQVKLQAKKAVKEEISDDIWLIFTYRQGFSSTSPTGLYYLESYVEGFGYKARVQDISAELLLDILQNCIENHKTNIIGFYCSHDNEYLVKNAISFIKQNSNIITFVGGPQAISLGEGFLRETGCDAVTEGEGEEALKELLDYYINKKGSLRAIKNIKYIDENNQYCCNEMREPIKNLDILPFPKLQYNEKRETQPSLLSFLITGRGCPYRCRFCYEGAHAKVVRYRSIKNVFDEIDYIIKENPTVKYIQIYDDTFTLDTKRVLAFCKEMKRVREYHDLKWICQAHANNLYKNPELVAQMVDAGLYCIQIGVESGSQRVLDAYNKKVTPKMICEVVKICKDAGLTELLGNIIVGGAWESRETVEDSIELARSLISAGIGMIELNSCFFAPYPHTAMTNCPEQYGIEIIKEQMDKSIASMKNVVVKTQALSRTEIIEAKADVDKAILDEYRKQTLKLDKEIIFSKFLNEDNSIKVQTMWGKQLYQYEHIRNYIKMTAGKSLSLNVESNFEAIFPIRTFELLEYMDNKLTTNGLTFENMLMKVLEYSTGRYTISQIAEILDTDSSEIYKICTELENRCLIYYSCI